ncbi:MAG: hypothetical protein JETT_1704 [Candidatus Jettenia ecosi]|uniref:Uncharacterized protein n=1 Tax=Candidatus Jettenia ecosi TaxID=2494326 RepID=A0A533QBL8_9BACT|nr:MAG: hypothetical protein JETT_1704 [Candidatus Jettenia ecosi]
MSLRGFFPKQSLLKLAKDCFGQDPRNDWRRSLSSVEDMFGFIIENTIVNVISIKDRAYKRRGI